MNTAYATKEVSIKDIEAMTPEDMKLYLVPNGEIIPNFKDDYTLYLVDFGGYFGYSCCVFYGTHHIHYANDYQLHHSGKSREELRDYYLREMDNKLFTEAEIASPLNDYDEFTRREYFLHNYYAMRCDYQSIFGIGGDPIKPDMIYDPAAFAYYDPKDKEFVKHHVALYMELIEARNAMKNSMEYWIGAFYYEMCNHEYGINWEADFDTLSAFGNIKYYEDARLEDYFDQLNFNDVQRTAYYKARNRYYEKHTDF